MGVLFLHIKSFCLYPIVIFLLVESLEIFFLITSFLRQITCVDEKGNQVNLQESLTVKR